MAGNRTIVVTGMGVVSAAGDSPESLWQSVVHGVSPAVAYSDRAIAGSPVIPACVVTGPDAEVLRRRRSHKMDRCVQLALEAAVRAHADAGLDAGTMDASEMGIVSGTSRGSAQKFNEGFEMIRAGRRELPPSLAAHSTIDSLSGALSMALDARGPCLTVSTACASGAYAIALAAQQLLLGEAEIMIAGGADAPLQDAVVRQLLATGILGSHDDPRRACRPFDVTRNGTIIGDGAAFLVLETLESARRRGARIHARLLGWAMGSDAASRTSPRADGEGLLKVMRRALHIAGVRPDDIDYINAHGTGTQLNDLTEAAAMSRLLGHNHRRAACSSTKPVTGHCMGASAALEALITILALRKQLAPPTANCRELDPACSVNVVTGEARSMNIHVAMSNSMAFWGKNASLILARDEAA